MFSKCVDKAQLRPTSLSASTVHSSSPSKTRNRPSYVQPPSPAPFRLSSGPCLTRPSTSLGALAQPYDSGAPASGLGWSVLIGDNERCTFQNGAHDRPLRADATAVNDADRSKTEPGRLLEVGFYNGCDFFRWHAVQVEGIGDGNTKGLVVGHAIPRRRRFSRPAYFVAVIVTANARFIFRRRARERSLD